MKAIGHPRPAPLSEADALVEFEAPEPEPGPRDLLVEIRGVSVNPVDVKVRAGFEVDGEPRILGYDGAGVVRAVGRDVERFSVGDPVFYAGDLTRSGTNAELHAVDERIVGPKPSSLGFAEAAGMPLTSLTAWELLFDALGLREGEGEGETLLVVGGAGGVGSILIQLAKRLTGLTVVASASRPETREWVAGLGADHVVDHREPLDAEMKRLGLSPRFVASLTHTEHHYPALVDLIQPFGRLALIDDPASLDPLLLKRKAISLCWEFMFARSMYRTADLAIQHGILGRVSRMLDEGSLTSTVTRNEGPLALESLRSAHAHQESGRAIGKTVLGGFS